MDGVNKVTTIPFIKDYKAIDSQKQDLKLLSEDKGYELPHISGDEVAFKYIKWVLGSVVVTDKTETIPFETKYKADNTLSYNASPVVKTGELGKRIIKQKYETVNGVKTDNKIGEPMIEETAPKYQHITKGTKPEEVRVELPVEVEYIESTDMAAGEEVVIQEGIPATKITKTLYLLNPKTGEITIRKNENIIEGIPTIIERGTNQGFNKSVVTDEVATDKEKVLEKLADIDKQDLADTSMLEKIKTEESIANIDETVVEEIGKKETLIEEKTNFDESLLDNNDFEEVLDQEQEESEFKIEEINEDVAEEKEGIQLADEVVKDFIGPKMYDNTKLTYPKSDFRNENKVLPSLDEDKKEEVKESQNEKDFSLTQTIILDKSALEEYALPKIEDVENIGNTAPDLKQTASYSRTAELMKNLEREDEKPKGSFFQKMFSKSGK